MLNLHEIRLKMCLHTLYQIKKQKPFLCTQMTLSYILFLVFVTRNNSNNSQTRPGVNTKTTKLLLEEKLEALRIEIEHRRNVIDKEKEINKLLKQQPKELAQQR